MSQRQLLGTEEFGVLAELGHAFATTLDINQTVRQAVEQIAIHMDAEAAALFLIDGNKGELVCRACSGPVDVTGLRVPRGRGIVGRAIKQNKVQLVQNVATDVDQSGFRQADRLLHPFDPVRATERRGRTDRCTAGAEQAQRSAV